MPRTCFQPKLLLGGLQEAGRTLLGSPRGILDIGRGELPMGQATQDEAEASIPLSSREKIGSGKFHG